VTSFKNAYHALLQLSQFEWDTRITPHAPHALDDRRFRWIAMHTFAQLAKAMHLGYFPATEQLLQCVSTVAFGCTNHTTWDCRSADLGRLGPLQLLTKGIMCLAAANRRTAIIYLEHAIQAMQALDGDGTNIFDPTQALAKHLVIWARGDGDHHMRRLTTMPENKWLPSGYRTWLGSAEHGTPNIYGGQTCSGCGNQFMFLRKCSRCRHHKLCSEECHLRNWASLKHECRQLATHGAPSPTSVHAAQFD
jgi:hypothetical protein